MATTVTNINFTKHVGGNRASAIFLLDSGEPVDRRIRNAGNNEAAALAKANEMITDVDLSIQQRDAERAGNENADIAASGTATKKQVAIRRIKSFVEEKNPIAALRKIRKIVSFIVAEGWTAAQIKTQLNITSAQWSVITAKRDYLLANQVTIDAFEVVQNGVPE